MMEKTQILDERTGLREMKIARQKLELRRLLLIQMNSMPLSEVNVDALCSEAMISRVSFYRYFPTRNHILAFLTSVNVYLFKTENRRKGYTGLRAIEHLFHFFGEQAHDSRYFYSSMLPGVGNRKELDSLRSLNLAEMRSICPDEKDLPGKFSLRMGDFFKVQVGMAFKNGELKKGLTKTEALYVLASAFQGCGVFTSVDDSQDSMKIYKSVYSAVYKVISK